MVVTSPENTMSTFIIVALLVYIAVREWRITQYKRHALEWQRLCTEACEQLKESDALIAQATKACDDALELNRGMRNPTT